MVRFEMINSVVADPQGGVPQFRTGLEDISLYTFKYMRGQLTFLM